MADDMSNLSLQEIHEHCLHTTQIIIQSFGWDSIIVGSLSEEDKTYLWNENDNAVLNWRWAIEHYRGNANDNGILDISLKSTKGYDYAVLHAAIICKYDARRKEFAICMLENLRAHKKSALTGNVFIIALIYSTTFCSMMELDDVVIHDPLEEMKPRYRSYGFSQVFYAPNKMSSAVADIQTTIRRKVMGIH